MHYMLLVTMNVVGHRTLSIRNILCNTTNYMIYWQKDWLSYLFGIQEVQSRQMSVCIEKK